MKRCVIAVTAVILLIIPGISAKQETGKSSLFVMYTYMTFTAYADGTRAGPDDAEQSVAAGDATREPVAFSSGAAL